MHVSFPNLAALLVLAAAASLSWYFGRPAAEAPQTGDGAESAPPGYYLREATLLGTDETGRTLFRIHAAEAVQDRDDDGLSLTDVRVEYRDAQAVDWSISAERAVTPADRSHIDLEDARLEADEAPGRQRMVIESPQLRLDPAEYLASSDARVSIRVGGAAVAGVGLDARLHEDLITLRSEVHGSFAR